MKKIISFSVALMLIFTFMIPMLTANAYNKPLVSITASQSSVVKGSQITVIIKHSASDAKIGVLQYSVSYNTSVFEYVSHEFTTAGSGLVNDAGGTLTGSWYSTSGANEVTQKIVFKTKSAGSADITVATQLMTTENEQAFPTPDTKKTTVTVLNSAPKSTNANLKSVSFSLGGTSGKATLVPAFSAAITSYTVKVPHDTDNVSIEAVVAEIGKAKTALDGPWKAPASGDWVRKVVVTAEDGVTKKTYTFKIVKDAAPNPTPTPDPDPTPTPDPDPTPNEDLRVIVGENEYYVVTDFSGLETPSGFEQNITTYNNIEVPCYTSKDGAVTLLVLEDAEGNKDLFLYNRRYLEISAFEWNEVGAGKYIFANAAQYTNLVNDLGSVDVKINGETVTAYKLGNNSEFVLVWAISTDGVGKLYVYDCTEKTIQRYADIHETVGNANNGYNPEPLTKSVKLYIVVIIVALMLAVILILIIAWLSALGKLRRIEGNRKEFDFVPFMEENNAITEFVAANEAEVPAEQSEQAEAPTEEAEAPIEEEPETEE